MLKKHERGGKRKEIGEKFIQDGFGTERIDFMSNDFAAAESLFSIPELFPKY